jgi:hypothetical protein
MYRQGDVLLVPVELSVRSRELDYVYRDKGEGIILAAGEATGHHHRIRTPGAREYRGPTAVGTPASLRGKRFLTVGKKGAELTHEEHDTIQIPQGTYEIVQQREYAPVIRDNSVVERGSRAVYD